MIARITSGKSVYGLLAYNNEKVNNGKGEILLCHDVFLPKKDSVDINSCMVAFAPLLDRKLRTKKNLTFHVSLSPHPEDKLTNEEMSLIAEKYMRDMGYGEQPYIVYLHKDIDRVHMHVVSLRVDRNGKKIEHDNERRRSMTILRRIEKEFGLIPAIKGERLAELEDLRKVDFQRGDLKREIGCAVRNVLDNYRFCSVKELNTLLNILNVYVDEVTGEYNGNPYHGIIYGALDGKYRAGIPLKSSRIGKDTGYERIKSITDKTKEELIKDPQLKKDLKQVIGNAMRMAPNMQAFGEML